MLEVIGISRRYGRFEAVKDFSFTALPGQVLGLLGQNGAGKSTLMNVLAGCLSPSAGRVLFNGVDLAHSPQQAKSHLGYLPEIPPVYPEMKVIEYLQFCCQLKGILKQDQQKHIMDIIQLVELGTVSHQLIGSLSKGFRQRVGLAQAMVGDPEVLLLDEPTSGFDPAQAVAFRKLIGKLAKNKVIVFSSHLLGEVEAICDRVLVIHQGRLVLDHLQQQDKEQILQYRLVVDALPAKVFGPLRQLQSVYRARLLGGSPRGSTTSIAVETKADSNFPREVFTLLCGLNAPVLELTPRQETLEDLFLRATANQEQPA